MSIATDLSASEVLGIAIKSEIDAAAVYDHLAKKIRNRALSEKIIFLRKEEEQHRRLLEEMFTRNFPGVELLLPEKGLHPEMNMEVTRNMTVPELFELAMEAEETSRDFYADLAEKSKDESGRATLRYLSNMESGHYYLLKTEYEMVTQFPGYYEADDFHVGMDLIHVGP